MKAESFKLQASRKREGPKAEGPENPPLLRFK